MPDCPHKIIVRDREGEYWRCEWCRQQFIPQTRTCAEKFIADDEKQIAINKQFEEMWRERQESK